MAQVFVSYSRENDDVLDVLGATLRKAGFAVWRDLDAMQGGRQWPVVIGRAIADCDVVLLVWSKKSAASDFVEFEWATAIALKKGVVPFLLDDTPLPPALSAVNGIGARDTNAQRKLLESLRRFQSDTETGQREAVLDSLESINTEDPKHVVAAVTSAFASKGWSSARAASPRSPRERSWQDRCPGCFEEKGSAGVCGACGYDESAETFPTALPLRTVIQDQYLIGRVLGRPGGFGIVYLSWDIRLRTSVAVKEFFPRDHVTRDGDRTTVVPHDPKERDLYRYGVDQFLDEARTLARFDHRNVVRVRSVLEQHDTAYLVMDYYEGTTVHDYMNEVGKLSESVAVDIMISVLDGLREVHRQGFLHRDIKPENVYLTTTGRPLLLDFGTARQAVGERSQSLTAILTPGYAPFEQYLRKGTHGEWTDVYGAAATLYTMLTGKVPEDAPARMSDDSLAPPHEVVPEVSRQVSDAVMRALAPKPKDRVQSAVEFQDLLLGEATAVPASGNGDGALAKEMEEGEALLPGGASPTDDKAFPPVAGAVADTTDAGSEDADAVDPRDVETGSVSGASPAERAPSDPVSSRDAIRARNDTRDITGWILLGALAVPLFGLGVLLMAIGVAVATAQGLAQRLRITIGLLVEAAGIALAAGALVTMFDYYADSGLTVLTLLGMAMMVLGIAMARAPKTGHVPAGLAAIAFPLMFTVVGIVPGIGLLMGKGWGRTLTQWTLWLSTSLWLLLSLYGISIVGRGSAVLSLALFFGMEVVICALMANAHLNAPETRAYFE